MWKAIMKLIEKWSYRCDHEWKKEHVNEVYDNTSELPIRIERTYMCTKCMDFKKLM